MIFVITICATLAFVCFLLRRAYQRRQRLTSAYTRSHRLSPDQQPTATLWGAVAITATHGLGMIKKSVSG
jgi:hypothetical protein